MKRCIEERMKKENKELKEENKKISSKLIHFMVDIFFS
jgi:hypothetical protein